MCKAAVLIVCPSKNTKQANIIKYNLLLLYDGPEMTFKQTSNFLICNSAQLNKKTYISNIYV